MFPRVSGWIGLGVLGSALLSSCAKGSETDSDADDSTKPSESDAPDAAGGGTGNAEANPTLSTPSTPSSNDNSSPTHGGSTAEPGSTQPSPTTDDELTDTTSDAASSSEVPSASSDDGDTTSSGAGGSGGMSPGGGGGSGGESVPDATGGAGGMGTGPAITGTPIVYVGGYGANYPLTTYDLDKITGALTHRAETTDAGESPSYIALTPNHKFMIVANEVDGEAGGLTSLAIAADGSLTRVNHVTGSDGGFTYVGIDPSGKFAMGASYNGGSTSIFPIAEDGTLGEQLDNMDFGNMAQTHCIGFAPEGGFAFVPNKGNNEVAMLVIAADGTLSSNPAMPVVPSDDGAGPRHIAVRADGKLAFVINELGSSLTPYTVADGILTKGTSVSSLPTVFNGQNTGGHVELSPDGRFVYGSNRGHDSIVVFAADAASGALTLLEHEDTRGQTPRDFEVDPAGDVLIVANQDSTNLAVFGIENDGTLSPLGEPISGPPQPCAVQVLYLD